MTERRSRLILVFHCLTQKYLGARCARYSAGHPQTGIHHICQFYFYHLSVVFRYLLKLTARHTTLNRGKIEKCIPAKNNF